MQNTLTEDEWIEKHNPLPAPLPGNGFDFGDGCTLLDGTAPEEIEALEAAGEQRTWTVVDDGEVTSITTGRHFVNRLGYIITEQPWSESVDIELEND